MGDVDGGLLKCVLQLAACSDKLRMTDTMLGGYVATMKKELVPSVLPVLKARLAVVPVDSAPPPQSTEERFQELFDHGSEAAERVEVTKKRLENELRRRSEQFQEIVSSRNNDLQEEYKRMQKELDEQAESLTKQIADERVRQQSLKRRRVDATTQAMKRSARQTKHSVEQENKRLQGQVDALSAEIKRLQEVFETLEEENTSMDEDASQAAQSSVKQQDEALVAQVGSLRREVDMLRDAKNSIAATQSTSFKAQYEAEKAELDDEIAHLKQVTDEIQKQLGSHGKRLQALVGTLAPSSSAGALMTRLYKQLLSDTSGGPRKTVDLPGFLKSCPSVDEGKRAIDEMKKLQLIYCYESSGIIALAD